MHRNIETPYEKRKQLMRKSDHLAKVLQASRAMNMRYTLIPSSKLMVGSNVVRFNTPGAKLGLHRVGPKGIASIKHIPLSAGTVRAAEAAMKVSGKVLLVISIVASGIRIGNSIYEEIHIDEEIEALKQIVDCLREDQKNDNTPEVSEALETAQALMKDAQDCKQNPGKKTLLTTLCTGAEWGGAIGMGLIGAQTGAAVGAMAGPLGVFGGAVTGSVLGAMAGSELAGSAVENFKCNDEGLSTVAHSTLANFGKKEKTKLAPIRGKFFVRDGLEVGANASLLEHQKLNGDNFKVGKLGANCGFTEKGVDVGLEAKPVWTEVKDRNKEIGMGLNLDTRLTANEDGVDVSLLGFGVKFGEQGAGFKLPVLNVFWKNG